MNLVAIIVGAGVLIHYLCMANFMRGHKSHTLVIIVMCAATTGGNMAIFAFLNNLDVVMYCSILCVGSQLAFSLWLWIKGFKVCEFLEKLE